MRNLRHGTGVLLLVLSLLAFVLFQCLFARFNWHGAHILYVNIPIVVFIIGLLMLEDA